MLEPWLPKDVLELRYRAAPARHGFDLEPLLPDPAPAFVDPDGTLHPALTEPLSSVLLHAFPTPGARSALVARMLSEPGRPDTAQEDDPFVAIYRWAASRDMEPAVTGSLALLLLRGVMADVAKGHRQRLPDPAEAYVDPEHDPWRHQRARLHTVQWDGLWGEIQAGAALPTPGSVFDFERTLVEAAHSWLGVYRTWWAAADLLGDDERIPEDPAEQQALDSALAAVRAACVEAIADDGSAPGSASVLEQTIAFGVDAESAFMQATAGQSDTMVNAKWLLGQQLRSLRHLDLATRDHSLHLHRLLRLSDTARVVAQVSYRVALLDLWLRDARGEDTEDLEAELLGVAPPPHPSTLGGGLGRILGIILLRRLRRGDDRDALLLAEQAMQLAPGELSVRMTWNDIHYFRGAEGRASNGSRWSDQLLRSLREEQGRWESLSVSAMGARVADGLGDTSRSRWFREHLVERAIRADGGAAWALAVVETLGDRGGKTDRDLLEHLSDWGEQVQAAACPLSWILFGTGEQDAIDAGLSDLRAALAASLSDLRQSAELVPTRVTPSGRTRQAPAWRQLMGRKWPDPSKTGFPSALWARVQALRAASPDLREHPVASSLRTLQELTSRAADLVAEDRPVPDALFAAWQPLGDLRHQLATYLDDPVADIGASLATWVIQAADPLRVAVREPRARQLAEEIDRLVGLCRVHGEPARLEQPSRLRRELAEATTDADPDAALDRIDGAIHELAADLLSRDPHASPEQPPDERIPRGLMRFDPEFEDFSVDELGTRPDALRRAREMVRLFNLAGGRRDRKKLKGSGSFELFELRHRTAQTGGLRVFYRPDRGNWLALAAMSKYDNRHQRDAIERIRNHFAGAP